MTPDTTLSEQRQQRERERLAALKASLSDEELEAIVKGQQRGGRAANIAAQIGTGVGAAGALGGAGYGGYRGVQAVRGKDKKSADESAYEQLVAQRMYDHLSAAGYDADAYFGLGQEKTASDEFEEILDRDALTRLQEAGVPVEWNE